MRATRPEQAGVGRRVRRALARQALPLATASTLAVAVAAAPLARRVRRHLPDELADLVVTGGLAATGWAALAVGEWLAPAYDEWSARDHERLTDVQHVAIGLVPTLLAARASAGLADHLLTAGGRRPGGGRWPERAPLPARVGLALLVTELIHYAHHRAAHTVPLLWRAHAVHHSETRLHWMNGTRFHALDEVPLAALQVLALRLMGVDPDALVTHNVLKLVHGLLQHANIAGSCGPLQELMSTAGQHRLHHEPRPRDAGVNYGAVLSVWDRAFGTDARPDRAAAGDGPPVIGLTGMAPLPDDFVGQLLVPFRWRQLQGPGAAVAVAAR